MATQTKKITLDTVALLFGRAVGLLLGVVRLNYLATYLGVANFGILNFATYFTSLFQSLFDLGISQLLTRELARDRSRSNELIGTSLVLKAIIVLVASLFVGTTVIVSQFDHLTNWAVLLTTVVLAINGLSALFLSAFQAHRRMVLVSAANILNDVLISIAVILLIASFPNVITVLLLTILVSLLNLAVLVSTYIRIIGTPQLRMNTRVWKMLFKEGAPITVSSFGVAIYMFIGPTVLKYYRGETEVGVFSAGYKLISILTLIPATFSQVTYPIFSDFYANAAHKLGKALQDSLRVMAEISIPLAVGTVILAPRIIGALYPPAFSNATVVLQLIIVGNSLGFLGWIMYTFLLAIEKQNFCMWNSLAVASMVLLANVFLVPRFGFVVVAAISMVTEIILFCSFAVFVVRRGYTIHDVTVLAKILGSAAVMGLAVYGFREWYLLPVIVCGACVYFVVAYALRTFGDQERELLAKLLNR